MDQVSAAPRCADVLVRIPFRYQAHCGPGGPRTAQTPNSGRCADVRERLAVRVRIPAMDSTAWTTVCDFDALLPDVGVRALVGDAQVAVFRLSRPDDVFAIDAFDPFSNAPVLSRGIVGDLKGQLVVASPIYKQHFNLQTGRCLEDEAVAVRTYPVRVVDGHVQVRQ